MAGRRNEATHCLFSCLTGSAFRSSAVCPSALRLRPRRGSRHPLQGRGRGLQVGGRPPDCQHGGRRLVAGLSPGRRPRPRGTGPLSAASPEVGGLTLRPFRTNFSPLLLYFETGELSCSDPKSSSDLRGSKHQVRSPTSKPLYRGGLFSA